MLLGKCGSDLKGNGYFSVISGLLHQWERFGLFSKSKEMEIVFKF